MLVSPVAGRALNAVGADRLAMGGYALAGAGTLALAAAASAQGYAQLLPGILMLSIGLALATAPSRRSVCRKSLRLQLPLPEEHEI